MKIKGTIKSLMAILDVHSYSMSML